MITLFRSLFAPPRHYLLVFAALWLGLTLAEKRTERHGVSKEALNSLTFYGIIAYILGGRIIYVLLNVSAFVPSPLSIFSPNPDLFNAAGGLLSAIIISWIYGRRQSLPFWGTLDSLTPIFALLAIGLPLAHLAAGTAFGSPTNLPWGIDLWNATRHPTQIYELIAALIIFFLLWFRKVDLLPGMLFLNFTAWSAGARLFLETFRGDSTLIFGGLRFAQVAAWVILAATFFASEMIQRQTISDKTETASPEERGG